MHVSRHSKFESEKHKSLFSGFWVVKTPCISVEFVDVATGSRPYGQVFVINNNATLVEGKLVYTSEDGRLFLYFRSDVTETGCEFSSGWVVGPVQGGDQIMLWATSGEDILPIATSDTWRAYDPLTNSFRNTSLTLSCYGQSYENTCRRTK